MISIDAESKRTSRLFQKVAVTGATSLYMLPELSATRLKFDLHTRLKVNWHIAESMPVSGQMEQSVVVEAIAEAEAPCVREHHGEVAALDALAQQSNWSPAPPADLEAGERKPHMYVSLLPSVPLLCITTLASQLYTCAFSNYYYSL